MLKDDMTRCSECDGEQCGAEEMNERLQRWNAGTTEEEPSSHRLRMHAAATLPKVGSLGAPSEIDRLNRVANCWGKIHRYEIVAIQGSRRECLRQACCCCAAVAPPSRRPRVVHLADEGGYVQGKRVVHLADHGLVQLGEAAEVKGRQDLAVPLHVGEVSCGRLCERERVCACVLQLG